MQHDDLMIRLHHSTSAAILFYLRMGRPSALPTPPMHRILVYKELVNKKTTRKHVREACICSHEGLHGTYKECRSKPRHHKQHRQENVPYFCPKFQPFKKIKTHALRQGSHVHMLSCFTSLRSFLKCRQSLPMCCTSSSECGQSYHH